MRHRQILAITAIALAVAGGSIARATLPDGRQLAPAGFTIPVEGFASAHALSPDGRWLAVLAQDGGAIDVISTDRSTLVDRLAVPQASGLVWTTDGLYVTRGYSGTIARYSYEPGAKFALTKRLDLQVEASGLLNGIDEDPATHRIAVARTADREVVILDDETGRLTDRATVPGQPFRVVWFHGKVVASLYDGDSIATVVPGQSSVTMTHTGPHPTQLLVDGDRLFVANADGHDVSVIDGGAQTSIDLSTHANQEPGQTPAGMAVSADRTQLFVTESGFNDVAVVDLASRRTIARIPAGWYPTAVSYVAKATVPGKDPRTRDQLWITSAKGLGAQADPAGEWNGTYTGVVQHLIVEPNRFAAWTAGVARINHPAAASRSQLPPIKHFVFIVRENKHFDEEFGDESRADSDPSLLLYGRSITRNAHALAERYTLFDNFMGNGEASIYGHAWTVQSMTNDYHERNAHARDESTTGIEHRVPYSIWPYAEHGEDTVTPAQMDYDWFTDLNALPNGPRMNVSGIFGPRGELIDALARANVSFRVYGEQMTMLADGRIADGLAAHADPAYPGDHINFGVLDTERAKLFLSDLATNGLAAYTYITLPTDHTAGSRAGFLKPVSYVANNDVALGEIVAGLSRRPEWRDTMVFVTTDDAQGTGDHLDSHRMPAFAIGPYVRRGFIDHTHYSYPAFFRTVETALGVTPLNIYDSAAAPMTAAFARQPQTDRYAPLGTTIPLEPNPGGTRRSITLEIDGPDSAAIPAQEWRSLRHDPMPYGFAAAVAAE